VELFPFFSPQKISERINPTKLDPARPVRRNKPDQNKQKDAPTGESELEELN
jgi:hypothetical protein